MASSIAVLIKHQRTLLTLCPSPSTSSMLQTQSFDQIRLWPRGVDLGHFSPSKRSSAMRASWGVGEAPTTPIFIGKAKELPAGTFHTDLPLTPPASPWVMPADSDLSSARPLPERVVLLYVGRVYVKPPFLRSPSMEPPDNRRSWEKNLHFLLQAYGALPAANLPKLVFVGEGPARTELQAICERKGYYASFMGHRSGEELARCDASADVFAFPSFTEVRTISCSLSWIDRL